MDAKATITITRRDARYSLDMLRPLAEGNGQVLGLVMRWASLVAYFDGEPNVLSVNLDEDAWGPIIAESGEVAAQAMRERFA